MANSTATEPRPCKQTDYWDVEINADPTGTNFPSLSDRTIHPTQAFDVRTDTAALLDIMSAGKPAGKDDRARCQAMVMFMRKTHRLDECLNGVSKGGRRVSLLSNRAIQDKGDFKTIQLEWPAPPFAQNEGGSRTVVGCVIIE